MTSSPPSARAEELLHKILWEGCSLPHGYKLLTDTLDAERAEAWVEAAEKIRKIGLEALELSGHCRARAAEKRGTPIKRGPRLASNDLP